MDNVIYSDEQELSRMSLDVHIPRQRVDTPVHQDMMEGASEEGEQRGDRGKEQKGGGIEQGVEKDEKSDEKGLKGVREGVVNGVAELAVEYTKSYELIEDSGSDLCGGCVAAAGSAVCSDCRAPRDQAGSVTPYNSVAEMRGGEGVTAEGEGGTGPPSAYTTPRLLQSR